MVPVSKKRTNMRYICQLPSNVESKEIFECSYLSPWPHLGLSVRECSFIGGGREWESKAASHGTSFCLASTSLHSKQNISNVATLPRVIDHSLSPCQLCVNRDKYEIISTILNAMTSLAQWFYERSTNCLQNINILKTNLLLWWRNCESVSAQGDHPVTEHLFFYNVYKRPLTPPRFIKCGFF